LRCDRVPRDHIAFSGSAARSRSYSGISLTVASSARARSRPKRRFREPCLRRSKSRQCRLQRHRHTTRATHRKRSSPQPFEIWTRRCRRLLNSSSARLRSFNSGPLIAFASRSCRQLQCIPAAPRCRPEQGYYLRSLKEDGTYGSVNASPAALLG
jgi:hypothetical protein